MHSSTDPRPAPQDPAPAAGAVEPIPRNDPRHVLLARLLARRSRLECRLDDGELFHTAILELAPDDAYFVLDALSPADGNARLSEPSDVALRAVVGDLEVRFRSRVVDAAGDDGARYYKAVYPTLIEYPQRRSEYRVTVPLSKGIELSFDAGADCRVAGEVRDLSPSGLSARVVEAPNGTLDQLENARGRCEIAFPDGSMVFAAIEVCHVFPARGRSAPRIGARFIELDPRTERAIERIVAQLEREQARLR